jgi:hypothetical protein
LRELESLFQFSFFITTTISTTPITMNQEQAHDVLNTTMDCLTDSLDISIISMGTITGTHTDTKPGASLNISFQLDPITDLNLSFQMGPKNRESQNDSQYTVPEDSLFDNDDSVDDLSLDDSRSMSHEDSYLFDCDISMFVDDDKSMVMDDEPIVVKPKVDYSNIDLSDIPQNRWTVYNFLWNIVPNHAERNHFIFLCEKYIPANEDTEHYNFWNLAASCLYCVCLTTSLPVVVEEIIESDTRITRNRMTKIGKNIRISEKVPNSIPVLMAVRMVSRLAETKFETSMRQCIPETTIQEKLAQMEGDTNMIGVNMYNRLILIYSLFIPTIKGHAIYSADISKACIFFRQPCTMWLLEMCQAYQKENEEII